MSTPDYAYHLEKHLLFPKDHGFDITRGLLCGMLHLQHLNYRG